MKIQNNDYSYYKIINSYLVFLIIFGIYFNGINSSLRHRVDFLDKITMLFAMIFVFIFIYYTRIQRFNFYKLFYDFLLSILLVFIAYVNHYQSFDFFTRKYPLFFTSLIMLIIIWNVCINKKIIINNYIILILIFSFTLLFNIIINGINGNTAIFKTISFLIYTLIYCYYIFVVTDRELIDILKNIIIYFIILSVISAFLYLRHAEYELFDIFKENHIITGMVYGIGFLNIFFDFKYKNIFFRIIKYGILSIFICLVLLTGARGPLICMLITIFINYLILFYKNKLKIMNLFVFLLFIIIFFSAFNFSNEINFLIKNYKGIEMLSDSYENLKIKNMDEFSTKRTYLYEEAYKEFLKKPFFGKGIGKHEKQGEYPHNLFLEILSQIGIIGFVPFFVIICCWFYFFLKSEMRFYKNSEYRFIKYLFIFYFFHSFFSGSIFCNIQFWGLLVLGVRIFEIENKNYKLIITQKV